MEDSNANPPRRKEGINMLIYAIEISQTASSGSWSFNTPFINNGLLKQIIVKSATGTTTFDFSLTDNLGHKPFDTTERESQTGKLNEMVEMPLKGMYTVAVDNASEDEAFTGRLMIQEI